MICPPCAIAADQDCKQRRERPDIDLDGHDPMICRDHGRAGCPCQHRPVGTATDQEGT